MEYVILKESDRIDFKTFITSGTICKVVQDFGQFINVQVLYIDESKKDISVKSGECIVISKSIVSDFTDEYHHCTTIKNKLMEKINTCDKLIKYQLDKRAKFEYQYKKIYNFD